MIWFIIKSLVFGLFGIFIAFAIIALLYAIISFILFNIFKNRWTATMPILCVLGVGAICWTFLGMYIATIAYELTNYMQLWLSITLTSIYSIMLMFQTNKTAVSLVNSNAKINTHRDFLNEKGKVDYIKFFENIKANFFVPHIFIVISFIVFLFIHNYANSVSFGLINYTLSIIK